MSNVIETKSDYIRIYDIFYVLKEKLEENGVKVNYIKPLEIKYKDAYKQEIFKLSSALKSALE
ncbi:MAG: hypothetical protein SVV88_08725 [Pseudomonadota bacterium]|jgi:hypothetical protein|nr:hypothetical protein [Pseudomonadota bacterium]